MPINGVVEIDPEIIYGLAKNKLGRFREFADEIRRACAGDTVGR
jgi:uncharacterized protein YutE (UPF0331/DUF86 family)